MNKRTLNISYKGTIETRTQSHDILKKPGDFIIIKRGVPRLIILRCPCGCGDELIINLDKRSGPAWRLYENAGSFTLFPSYWRDSFCQSHFIIWKNRIFWCSSNDNFDLSYEIPQEIESMILDVLKGNSYSNYLDLAENCGINPWESLRACKQLVEKGYCIVNKKNKNEFKKMI